jgi:DNA mismatch endonuclease (patch repair protein)
VLVHPDVVFVGAHVIVFVDGCFWHGCPEHIHIPKHNRAYWVPKLAANAARDRRVDEALGTDGWLVLHVWEHEPPETAADRVAAAVRARTHSSVGGRVSRPPTRR